MKRTLFWFAAAAVLGAGGTLRATPPCEPTTNYSLQAVSFTIDGASQPLPSGNYYFATTDEGSGVRAYQGLFPDPANLTARRRVDLTRAP